MVEAQRLRELAEKGEAIRSALRRLNPEFHKSDISWPSLDALEAGAVRLLSENEILRDGARCALGFVQAVREHDLFPACATCSSSLTDAEAELRAALAAVLPTTGETEIV